MLFFFVFVCFFSRPLAGSHQAWRDKNGGPQLAVVANDDERLHVVLENLGLLPYFDFVLTSREVKTRQGIALAVPDGTGRDAVDFYS